MLLRYLTVNTRLIKDAFYTYTMKNPSLFIFAEKFTSPFYHTTELRRVQYALLLTETDFILSKKILKHLLLWKFMTAFLKSLVSRKKYIDFSKGSVQSPQDYQRTSTPVCVLSRLINFFQLEQVKELLR